MAHTPAYTNTHEKGSPPLTHVSVDFSGFLSVKVIAPARQGPPARTSAAAVLVLFFRLPLFAACVTFPDARRVSRREIGVPGTARNGGQWHLKVVTLHLWLQLTYRPAALPGSLAPSASHSLTIWFLRIRHRLAPTRGNCQLRMNEKALVQLRAATNASTFKV
eukprot:GHVU01008987.1.p1 GENE.GHVU01008987.1~~GHVU01008987.1.p1  ORF type:complete len:163 (-),score=4.36 GHVU01008987.1:103-591(-)